MTKEGRLAACAVLLNLLYITGVVLCQSDESLMVPIVEEEVDVNCDRDLHCRSHARSISAHTD